MNSPEIILSGQIKNNKTPGVIYKIFDQRKILYAFKGGFADVAANKTINEETTFHGYSVTKTFTAVAILQLAEQKKMNLDDSVRSYLPGFVYPGSITIRHLLNHTSGIPNPLPLNWIHPESAHASFNRNVFFHNIFLKHRKIKSSPGERFSYTNLGYVLLGELIEKVSGEQYEEYIRKNILQRSSISPAELDFNILNVSSHAKGYQKQYSFMNLLLGFFIDKSKFMEVAESGWKPFKPFHVNGVAYGGLIGSATGFVKYLQELLKPNSNLLSTESKRILFAENHTTEGKSTGMCSSWFRGKLDGYTFYTHAGGGGGYYAEIRIYPERNLGSVILFNRTGMSDERFLNRLDTFFLNQ